MALSVAQGFVGSGDVYLTPILTGGGFGKRKDTGNTTKFAIKSNSTLKQQKSKKRDSYGTVLESVALQDPAELSMTLETVNRDSLRYCFQGEDAAYAQVGGAVLNEVVIMQIDGWVQLANEDLAAAGVVLTNSAGVTTYVEGTDYEVLRRLGWVRAKTGGAITDLQSCLIDYTANAFTGAAIRGNVQPQIRAMLELDGENKVDNSIGILRCWEVILSPSSEFDFFKDDFNTIELTGQLKVPPGRTEPFRFYAR
jgi:hypothetical protein